MKRPYRRRDKTFFVPTISDKLIREFGFSTDPSGLNALTIATAIFETEKLARTHEIRRLVIPLFLGSEVSYDLRAIAFLLHELMIFTLVEDIDIQFVPAQTQLSFEYTRPEISGTNVCLFSGGLDSYAGVLLAAQVFPELKAVFCAHSDQSRIIRIVEELQANVFNGTDIDVKKIPVPSMGARGYAQVRGFLYMLTSVAVAHKFGARNLLITECGPTMYQPRFGPLDSVTMTTHPFVVRAAAQIARLLLRRDVKLLLPFENLTKAEVVAICPEKAGLRFTHSCITQRFGTHDGTCYGCVIRRLATTAAGVRDVKYNKNPIADANARAGNLYAVLTFSYELLTDFRSMEEYQRGMIDTYNKKDLFRRFALDNFAAIHRLALGNKRIVRPIREIYEDLIRKIGIEQLNSRLRQLAEPSIKAAFGQRA